MKGKKLGRGHSWLGELAEASKTFPGQVVLRQGLWTMRRLSFRQKMRIQRK